MEVNIHNNFWGEKAEIITSCDECDCAWEDDSDCIPSTTYCLFKQPARRLSETNIIPDWCPKRNNKKYISSQKT